MHDIVHLDFETRSEMDLTDVGGAVYAAHPSTEIICIGWRLNKEPIEQYRREHIQDWDFWGPPSDCKLYRLAANPRIIFKAHNAFFEQMMWQYVMVERYGYPAIPIERWQCTAAKAAYYGLPRKLEKAAIALNLPVRKDMEGNKVMQSVSKPRSRTSKANPDRFWEPAKAPDRFQKTYEYNYGDVDVESYIDDVLPDLRPLEQQIWFMDQRMNHRGIKLDLPAVRRAIEFMEIAKEELLTEFRELTNGDVDRPSLRAQFMRWLTDNGCTLGDMQAATIDKLLAQDRESAFLLPAVQKALTIHRQLGRTSTAKYQAMLNRVSDDGRLRDILLYYGASRTGRWSGRGVQLQNLVRPKVDIYKAVEDLMTMDYEWFKFNYSVMDTIAEIVRGMIIADEGMELNVADFSAIEARVNAWLADEEELLDDFRNDHCNYCSLATDIYGRPINKKEHPDERQIGKVGELALGYEGGINAFVTMASTYRLDLTPAYPHIWASTTPEERELATKAYNRYRHEAEEPVSREFGLAADIIKQRYRAKRTKIKENWRRTEDAAVQAVITGKPVKCGKVTFFTNGVRVINEDIKRAAKMAGEKYTYHGKDYVRTQNGTCYEYDTYYLHVKLPSGRCLNYHKPSLRDVKTPWGKTKKQLRYWGVNDKKHYTVIDTYGGKLVENIVQAIARDLMAEGFLRIEKAGYTPVLQVHDEAISEAPIGFGSIEEYETLMAVVPDWGVGLPVRAEGWRGPRYKKG